MSHDQWQRTGPARRRPGRLRTYRPPIPTEESAPSKPEVYERVEAGAGEIHQRERETRDKREIGTNHLPQGRRTIRLPLRRKPRLREREERGQYERDAKLG